MPSDRTYRKKKPKSLTLPQPYVALINKLVDDGVFKSRSTALRAMLDEFIPFELNHLAQIKKEVTCHNKNLRKSE